MYKEVNRIYYGLKMNYKLSASFAIMYIVMAIYSLTSFLDYFELNIIKGDLIALVITYSIFSYFFIKDSWDYFTSKKTKTTKTVSIIKPVVEIVTGKLPNAPEFKDQKMHMVYTNKQDYPSRIIVNDRMGNIVYDSSLLAR